MDIKFKYKAASKDQSIHDLRRYHFERLVKLAYKIILKREPDNGGFTSYTDFLINGGSYEQLIYELRSSEEARNVSEKVLPKKSSVSKYSSTSINDMPLFTKIVFQALHKNIIKDI